AGTNGVTPIDLEFKAVGSYAQMMLFIRKVEGTVEAKDGKLYTRDRLFNVINLSIGGEDDNSTGGEFAAGFSSTGGSNQSTELTPGKGEQLFTIIVRMYSSDTKSAQKVGAATPDPAASGNAGAGSTAGS